MKKLLILLLCLSVLLSINPIVLTAYSEESGELSDTIIDKSGVGEDGLIWIYDELPPLAGSIEDEKDLYGNRLFDDENAIQLSGNRINDQILLKFKDPSQVPGKEKQLQQEITKFEKIGFVEGLGVYVIQVAELEKNPNAVLNRLKNNKYIEYVEPNYTAEFDLTPNDPAYVNQRTTLDLINALSGWDITTGAGSPAIAVIDSGVIATHPDLPELLSGYSAVASLSPNYDKKGHGTNVAGVIGAIGNNKVGVAGINWNASILPIKVDDAEGTLTVANIAKGIIWASDNGARVINLSLGITSDSVTLKNAVDYAYNKGCAIFAATGNSSTGSIHYPARYSNVIAVGGTTSYGTARASSSNYGTGIDVVAIGEFYSTSSSGGYASSSGTSFASPQAAALASLIWTVNPDLTNAQVYDLIREGAKPLGGGYNTQTGYGLIDIGKTLKQAVEGAAAIPAPPDPKPSPVITLTGFAELTIYAGTAYAEDGYKATDYTGKIITDRVKVSDNVNVWVPGIYTVIYTVTDDYGGSATKTRTVKVEPALPPPPPKVPAITVNGSGIIILHIGGTPYREQGARAIDYDGENISGRVEIIGEPDTSKAGTYTVTYRVTGKSGETATATRAVRVIAPVEVIERRPYSFSSQAKQGAMITHTNIAADQSGWMDLKVSSLDKNMTISFDLIDYATNQVVFKDTFSAAGMKQYHIKEGKYEAKVTLNKANGNGKYTIDLLMPEVITLEFTEEEVPLADSPQTGDIGIPMYLLILIGVSLAGLGITRSLRSRKRRTHNK